MGRSRPVVVVVFAVVALLTTSLKWCINAAGEYAPPQLVSCIAIALSTIHEYIGDDVDVCEGNLYAKSIGDL
jgi:hypothetical protein